MMSDEELVLANKYVLSAVLPWSVRSDATGCDVVKWPGGTTAEVLVFDPTYEDAKTIVNLANVVAPLLTTVHELQDLLARFRTDSEAYQMGKEDGAKEQRAADVQIIQGGTSWTFDSRKNWDVNKLTNTPLVTDQGS